MTERRDEGGLEYLVKAGKLRSIREQREPPDSPSSESSSAHPDVDRNLQAFAARVVLTTVKEMESSRGEGTGVRLSEVAERVGMGGDVLIPLARRLEGAGAIRFLDTDAFGNTLVTLTDDGRHLLQPDAAPDLMRRIASG